MNESCSTAAVLGVDSHYKNSPITDVEVTVPSMLVTIGSYLTSAQKRTGDLLVHPMFMLVTNHAHYFCISIGAFIDRLNLSANYAEDTHLRNSATNDYSHIPGYGCFSFLGPEIRTEET